VPEENWEKHGKKKRRERIGPVIPMAYFQKKKGKGAV